MSDIASLKTFVTSHVAGLENVVKALVSKDKQKEFLLKVLSAVHNEVGTKLESLQSNEQK